MWRCPVTNLITSSEHDSRFTAAVEDGLDISPPVSSFHATVEDRVGDISPPVSSIHGGCGGQGRGYLTTCELNSRQLWRPGLTTGAVFVRPVYVGTAHRSGTRLGGQLGDGGKQ